MATVLINLTYWAPGCADLPSDDDRLWRWLFQTDAADVLQRASRLAGVAITGLSLRAELQRIDICARVQGQPKPVPMVTVCQGLNFGELIAALSALIQAERKEAA